VEVALEIFQDKMPDQMNGLNLQAHTTPIQRLRVIEQVERLTGLMLTGHHPLSVKSIHYRSKKTDHLIIRSNHKTLCGKKK
jgi:hypothetical protein